MSQKTPQFSSEPIEKYFWYIFDQFGNIMVDQLGPIVIDIRNGIRVNPVDQYGNFMPFPMPQYYQPQPIPEVNMQQQPQITPENITTSSRIIRDTGNDINGDAFLLDEDFFLLENEKAKFPRADDITNYYNNVASQFIQPQNPIHMQSGFRPRKNINDLPIKIRYSEKDFTDFFMTSEMLAKHLVSVVEKEFGPDIRLNLIENGYGYYDLSILKYGICKGILKVDLERYGGKGLPIVYGIVGDKYTNNKVIVPLGAIQAVRECIGAIAYNTGGGVNAITQAKYEFEMLPQYIYKTVDFGVIAFPDGLDNYKQFGKQIERIHKYYNLNTRYRLYGYKDNFNFTLISDEFVKPFIGEKAPLLHESITVENNTLTIKQPNGNIKVVQMGV